MSNIYTIRIAKTNQTLEIDFKTLPEATKQYVIQYGLKQCLNDAHSAFKDVAEAKGQVEAKLEALQNGSVTLRATAERVDPIVKEVNEKLINLVVQSAKIRRKDLLASLKVKGLTIRDFIMKQNGGEATIAKFTKEAEAARKKLASFDFEIDVSEIA